MLRDVKLACKQLGFKHPTRTLHAFRHSFALNYLRRGGSVFHLEKVLGHSTLEMTRRYSNLLTSDLQAIHERVSLLSRLRDEWCRSQAHTLEKGRSECPGRRLRLLGLSARTATNRAYAGE
jgi:hypothetical protein